LGYLSQPVFREAFRRRRRNAVVAEY